MVPGFHFAESDRGCQPTQCFTPSETEASYRYQKKIEVFIDQLQERLGIEDAKDGNDPSLSLTDAALLSPDAMQASIARCMLAAYPPDLLIEISINTCGAHEFYRAEEVITAGEYWAEWAINRFENGNS